MAPSRNRATLYRTYKYSEIRAMLLESVYRDGYTTTWQAVYQSLPAGQDMTLLVRASLHATPVSHITIS